MWHNNYGLTNTAEECQLKCQQKRRCRWFNWNKEGRKDCYLKTDKGTEMEYVLGAVTGPRTCPGKCDRKNPKEVEGDGSMSA